jgi:predicted RNA-binding protein YlqC (UPF0109 family)
MKTYHVTLELRVHAETDKKAIAKLGRAAEAAMKVATAGVSLHAEEVPDD